MSALPPKADTLTGGLDVRFVPKADIADMSRLAAAMSPASPIARDRERSGRELQDLGRNIAVATLAE